MRVISMEMGFDIVNVFKRFVDLCNQVEVRFFARGPGTVTPPQPPELLSTALTVPEETPCVSGRVATALTHTAGVDTQR